MKMPAKRQRQKRLTPQAMVCWAALFAFVLAVAAGKELYSSTFAEAPEVASTNPAGRSLLSEGGAADWNPIHTEQGYKGPLGSLGIILWIPFTIWIFSGVAIAADEYFQPALESISDALDLSADVRGATFLAAASSAPEFFTSFADTFLVSDDGGAGYGVGTIIGSAVFNVLIIVALSTIPSLMEGKELKKNKPEEPEKEEGMSDAAYDKAVKNYKERLTAWENKMKRLEEEGSYLPIDWYPLARDCVFYSFSIIILAATVATDKPSKIDRKPQTTEGCVEWYESMVYIIVYAMYITFMIKSADFRPRAEAMKDKFLECCSCCKSDEKRTVGDLEAGHEGALDADKMAEELKAQEELDARESAKDLESDSDSDDDDDSHLFASVVEFEDEWGEPSGAFCNLMGIATIPFKLLFALTIPNVSRPAMKEHYVISFIMCILWIGFLSAMMVKVVSWMGAIIGLPPVAMGLVVLAAGTSVPDALGSYNEAKHGNADAAVSNALGSNVFDICVGLGVPWFLFALIKGRCFAVPAEDILIPTLILFFILFLFIMTLAYYKMRLYGQVGLVYLCIYVVFITWSIVNALAIGARL